MQAISRAFSWHNFLSMCCFSAAIPSKQCCHLKSAHVFHTVKTRPLSCIFIFVKLPKRDSIVQFCNGDFNKRTIHWKLISSIQLGKRFYRPSLNWDKILLISCSESARLNSSRITFRSKSYNIVIFCGYRTLIAKHNASETNAPQQNRSTYVEFESSL